MIPTNSGNSASAGCDPVSSNCVIWQGPDLPCLDICNGQSISDVVALLAQEVCDIINAACECDPDISTIVTGCVLDETDPPDDIQELIQAIIDYICDQQNFPGTDPILPEVQLPTCLYYKDQEGNPVTFLRLEEYVVYLANVLCDKIAIIDQIQLDLSSLVIRVTALEECVYPCEPGGADIPLIPSVCVLWSPHPDNDTRPKVFLITDVVMALEAAFCNLVDYVGTQFQVENAIASQCTDLTAYGYDGSLTTLDNWVANPMTLAETTQNVWNVLCDLRLAVKDILANCCVVGCDEAVYEVTGMPKGDGAIMNTIQLCFNGSSFPGFQDCGSTLVLSDGNQVTAPIPINVVQLANQNNCQDFGLVQYNLCQTCTISATIHYCIQKDEQRCNFQQTISINLALPCPDNIQLTPSDTSLAVTFSNNFPGSGVSYSLEVMTLDGNVFKSNLCTNPPLVVQPPQACATITGLSPGTPYKFRLTINPSGGGDSTTCPESLFTTNAIACAAQQINHESFAEGGVGALQFGNLNYEGDTTSFSISEDIDGNVGVQTVTFADPDAGNEIDPAGTYLEDASEEGIVCSPPGFTAPNPTDKWYFVNSYTITNGPSIGLIYFIYASWDTDPAGIGCTSIVLCCECPTYLADQHTTEISSGGDFLFSPLFVAFGDPAFITWEVVGGPLFGNVENNNDGTFLYVNDGTSKKTDSFEIQLTTPCGVQTAVCSANIQQAGSSGITIKGLDDETDIVVVVAADQLTFTDATVLKDTVTEVTDAIRAECVDWVGGVYFLAYTGDDFFRVFSYLWDRGVSFNQKPDVGLDTWESTFQVQPLNWTDPAEPDLTNVLAIVIQNNASSYCEISTAAGFASQPKVDWVDNVQEWQDLIKGTALSPWAIALPIVPGAPSYQKTRLLALPIANGANGPDGALKASMIAWHNADNVYNQMEWAGYKTGMTALTNVVGSGSLTPNPYNNNITSYGLQIEPLVDEPWNANFSGLLNFDVSTVEDGYAGDDIKDNLKNAIIQDGTCPGNAPFDPPNWALTRCLIPITTQITEMDLSIHENKVVELDDGVCYEVTETYDAATIGDVVVASDHVTCGDCTGTTQYVLTPCAGWGVAEIHTHTDLAAYVAQIINVAGVCYTFTEEEVGGITEAVVVCEAYVDCPTCLNWKLIKCTDDSVVHITCQDLSAYEDFAVTFNEIAYSECYRIEAAAVGELPNMEDALTVNASYDPAVSWNPCLECVSSYLGMGDPALFLTAETSSASVRTGLAGINPAANDDVVTKWLNQMAVGLGDVENASAAEEMVYLTTEGSALTDQLITHTGLASNEFLAGPYDAALDADQTWFVVGMRVEGDTSDDDQFINVSDDDTNTTGWGVFLRADGTVEGWSKDASNPANLIDLGVVNVDTPFVISIQHDVAGNEFRMQINEDPRVTVPLLYATSTEGLLLGGHRDGLGVPVEDTPPFSYMMVIMYPVDFGADETNAIIDVLMSQYNV